MLDLITNWIKLPFQLNYFTKKISNNKELGCIHNNFIVEDKINDYEYFSNTTKTDGFSHDTRRQFINQCIYMHLYVLDDTRKRNMISWVYRNLHGGRTLTSGFITSLSDGVAYDDRTTIETISVLNLLMLTPEYRDILADKYETLINNYIDNGYYINGLFQFLNRNVAFEEIKIKGTYCGPGSNPDQTIVLLAALSILSNSLGAKWSKLEYDKIYKKYGGNIKARFTSNKLSSIISLYVLAKTNKDSLYTKELAKKFNGNHPDMEVGNMLYTELLKAIKNV